MQKQKMSTYTKHYTFDDFQETKEPDESYVLGSTSVLIYRDNGIEKTYIIDSLSENYLVSEIAYIEMK